MKGITSEQLYTWQAPIDLIERYELYLNNPIELLQEQKFYNCTSPWFGLFCELSFNTSIEFSQLIKRIFSSKYGTSKGDVGKVTNYTCYEHIKCDRGPEPTCLDWREICDGKRDCFNNGVDEENCDTLEANECRPDEYRCHNGLCVPGENFGDSFLHPDCLDGSDEPIDSKLTYKFSPVFNWEERTCRRAVEFTCGNGGNCIEPTFLVDLPRCLNDRDGRISQSMINRMETPDLNEICWRAMVCVIELLRTIGIFCHCQYEECIILIQTTCPMQFKFPARPVMFSHVYFIYENNQTKLKSGLFLPDYICYDTNLCRFLPSTININESTCRYYHEFDLSPTYYNWLHFMEELTKIFRTCSVTNDTRCQKYSTTLFSCDTNSSKCISHHRRMDRIQDCNNNIDEETNGTCEIKQSQRMKCSSHTDVCIAPVSILDGTNDCSNGDDEKALISRSVSFQNLCNRFQEIPTELINGRNESDETDCEMWQCNNTYNRCNGIYNCLDEIDEANCPQSLCPVFYHPCVSVITKKFICLPMIQVNDDNIDCIGGSDERQYCRDRYPSKSQSNVRFRCMNDTKCLSMDDFCNNYEICEYKDDEIGCEGHTPSVELGGRCTKFADKNRTQNENLICNITDEFVRPIIYFSLRNAKTYPILNSIFNDTDDNVDLQQDQIKNVSNEVFNEFQIDLFQAWYCNYGIIVYESTFDNLKCLCPPSFYGDRCQYQNQRVSLTIQFYQELTFDQQDAYLIFVALFDDQYRIHSYDEIIYAPKRDCNTKHNVYLLYEKQPKDNSRNYSIRVDVFSKINLIYYTSWYITIPFQFLPVNRISTRLKIPAQTIQISKGGCSLKCVHGQCTKYGNIDKFFCRCSQGWMGYLCNVDVEHLCNCVKGSICVGTIGNRSICICPVGRFGPRCLLQNTVCSSAANRCNHNGQCIPIDDRISTSNYSCLCNEGFSGSNCEITNTKIEISFKDLDIPQAILAHFIQVFPNQNPVRSTLFKRIRYDTDTAIIFMQSPFHLVFVEISRKYYLTVVQQIYRPLNNIITRIKFYHVPCQQRAELVCFYDEKYMCLCDHSRHANCFEFDHYMNYNCQGHNYCENGQCFQDDAICPTISFCACTECFFGRRCQFNTQGFDLSLDAIIGHSIYPNVHFLRQPNIIKVTVTITIVMYLIALVNGILTLITFRADSLRKLGSGIYLITASIVALINIHIFALKVLFLILNQMSLITNLVFLRFNCITFDFLLKFLSNSGNWLSACVAIERTVCIWKKTKFNQLKSKYAAKWTIICVLLFTCLTVIPDPIYRRLIHDNDDDDEQRIWCIVTYAKHLKNYMSFMNIFHFIVPFIINFISALLIIIMVARTRSIVHKKQTYKEHLRQQFIEHKHLLITPCVLILLTLPRLIISFASSCMKSTREPWLYLIGYFISFIPYIFIFILFVVPSDTYMKQFKIETKWRRS